METWKGGRLEMIEGGEHEVLMGTDAQRRLVIDGIEKLFVGTVTS